MLRVLIYGLAILHLGPGAAFAIVAFGCDPSLQWLGSSCQEDTLKFFLGLTLMFWLMFALGTGVLFAAKRRPRTALGNDDSAARAPIQNL